jgi:MAE_28990/MAE_18760-like HEPN
MMSDLVQVFEERLQEIEEYLTLLGALEQQVQEGPPRIGATGPVVTVQQQKILYSSVFLQLYNLVEATVTRCIDAVAETVVKARWMPDDLSEHLRREWVRYVARTHTDLSSENRLKSALYLCEQLIKAKPVSDFKVEKGGGGNWDEDGIQDITERMGLSLSINPETRTGVKRVFRNEQGALAFIKTLRNDLAHGRLSFVECGEGVTVSELRDLKNRTVLYLKEVVDSFQAAIDSHEFLLPERRPTEANS